MKIAYVIFKQMNPKSINTRNMQPKNKLKMITEIIETNLEA